MERPELKVVYWEHGRYNSDMQDTVFEDVMPGFFRNKICNVMGIENAGNYTDEYRDKRMQQVANSPRALSSYSTYVPSIGDRPGKGINLLARYMTNMLAAQGMGSMLMRQSLLLNRWNRKNPNRLVLPFLESFETEAIRSNVDKRSDAAAGAIFFDIKEKIYWKDFVKDLRDSKDKELDELRHENWVRILADLLSSEIVRNATATRILLTIGRDHSDLTRQIQERLGDKLHLHDDLVMKSKSIDTDGGNDDELYLRKILFRFFKHLKIFNDVSDETAFYALDDKFIEAIYGAALNAPLEEICEYLNLSLVPLDNPLGRNYLKKTSNSLRLSDLKIQLDGSAGTALVDRSEHPNNIFLTKSYIVNALAVTLKLEKDTTPAFQLLQNLIEKINPTKLNTLRREVFKFLAGDDELLDGEKFPYFCSFLLMIARQDVRNPILWDQKDSAAAADLIANAKLLFNGA